MKIALIGTDDPRTERQQNQQMSGCTFYRLFGYFRHSRHEIDLYAYGFNWEDREPADFWDDFFSRYDAVIIRPTNNDKIAAVMGFFQERRGVPVILDMDDNPFGMTDDNPAAPEYQKGGEALTTMTALADTVSAIFVTSDELSRQVNKRLGDVFGRAKPTYTLPNCIDLADWLYPWPVRNETITIGWSGSISHDKDLEYLLPSLKTILQRNKDVYAEIQGGLAGREEKAAELFKNWKGGVSERCEVTTGIQGYDNYAHMLANKNWDIAVAPLVEDDFNNAKSHIKWMEYTMAGKPVIAQNTYPYREPIHGTPVIEHNYTGLLFDSKSQLKEQLQYLIDYPEERYRLWSNAYNFIRKNWQYKDWVERWDDAIDEVTQNYASTMFGN